MTFLSVCIEPKRGGLVKVVMRWIRPLYAQRYLWTCLQAWLQLDFLGGKETVMLAGWQVSARYRKKEEAG